MAAAQPVTTDIDLQTAAQFGEAVKRIHDEILLVIIGQDEGVISYGTYQNQ